jgi:hypothetical protein
MDSAVGVLPRHLRSFISGLCNPSRLYLSDAAHVAITVPYTGWSVAQLSAEHCTFLVRLRS